MINTGNERIKVLVVDDSAFMRGAISNMLRSDPEIEVIDTARDGFEAIEKVEKLKPDLVTLDIEMPRMDGLQALKIIMEKNPLPVLMLSSLTVEGAKATLDALDLGALDFIPKNLKDLSLNILNVKRDLIDKIKIIAKKKIIRKTDVSTQKVRHIRLPEKRLRESTFRVAMVAIGSSTGGPRALQTLLPEIPKNFPASILVVQHMPPTFIEPFAERLNQLCQVEVAVAQRGDLIMQGKVLIAPGGIHTKLKKKGVLDVEIELTDNPTNLFHKPSVDVMMLSVAEIFGGRSLGVILTGMGNDGMQGMKAIKHNNGRTVAQDETTCVVYGMPRAAVEIGVVDKILPIDEVAGEIINMV